MAAVGDWRALADVAGAVRDREWGRLTTYSRKVFLPLTQLCRDVCHYCTFAQPPRALAAPFLTPDRILAVAEAGAEAGCQEALFTLGDRPEARYAVARAALRELGHPTTVSYVAAMAERVRRETGLLPHLNLGILDRAEYGALRPVAPSFGLMLETAAPRLSQPGGPHHGSPDKWPAVRLEALRLAGELRIPTTTGLLVGIGETRAERIDALLALRALDDRYGHLQEVIIQNFRAKPGTRMSGAAEPSMDELCWTVAAARLILRPAVSLQAPPNLFSGDLADLIRAGINDWGGVSPVTPDHVNPEAPWPHIDRLADLTARAGKRLAARLTVYPRYIAAREDWIDRGLHGDVLRHSDGGGLARTASPAGDWTAGTATDIRGPVSPVDAGGADHGTDHVSPHIRDIVAKAGAAVGKEGLEEGEITALFQARGADFTHIVQAADRVRQAVVGDAVSFVVNRNINYTNICQYHCTFCAFSKGQGREASRDKPYRIDLAEIRRRVREAWDRGATEVCLQGGIHPDYTGRTYLDICEAAKAECPEIHVHAFSPLEVMHGATTLGRSVGDFLGDLKAAGLGSLPGTAAEILDDEIRRRICPDKLTTQEWLEVVRTAHGVGLPTTATIMFGHVEGYPHWARHIRTLAALQRETGMITEFVPLPFVHDEAPMFVRGGARKGPTLREAVLMHAVGRLAFHGLIANIQVSWVKMGPDGARLCLEAGANDLGGTLMNESISRAAGAAHGQELAPAAMEALATGAGRRIQPRTTLYGVPPEGRTVAAWSAQALQPLRYGALRRTMTRA